MGDDTDSYPSPSAPSSIFLFILYSISLMSSFIVIANLGYHGINTISSQLPFYLNISVFIWTLTKFPYLFIDIPHGCQVSGIIHWYCTFQMLIITYSIVDALNIKMLLASTSEINEEGTSSSQSYQLQFKKILAIFLIPIFPVIYPAVTHSFGSLYEWCGLDRETARGQTSRIIFLSALFFLQFGVVFKFIYLCKNLKQLPKDSYEDVLKKLFRGPGSYAATLISFIFLEDIITAWQYSSRHLSYEIRYTLEYIIVLGEGLFGITLALIYFLLEANDIHVSILSLTIFIYSYL